jgi:hypothetical protein
MLAEIEIPASASHLKLEAKGTWTAIAGLKPCGPDGFAGSVVPDDQLIMSDCAAAALIGRFGGSSATMKVAGAQAPADAKPFAVGSHVVVTLPDDFIGPLYLGFNLMRRPIPVQALTVDIFSGV